MEKYQLVLETFINSLNTLTHLLDKAEAHVKEKGVPESTLLDAKLAADMFDFKKQIQVATDDARRNSRLLAGMEHIAFEDTETTIAELKERIQKTLSIVKEISLDAFKDADARHISLYWMGENYVEGKDFVQELAIPNFMFHVAMAYAILRAQGVAVGKQDFITKLTMKPKN